MATNIQEYSDIQINYSSSSGDKISNVSADGLSLITDALTTPIQTIISGAGFDTGGAQVSFSNLYNLKLATPALRIPATNNVFLLENSVQVEDETTLPTRMGALTAVATLNPQLTLKADTGGAVWEEADLTQNGLTYIDNTGGSSSASWASIIAGGGGVPNINQVLAVGQNANNQPITNVNNIQIAGGTTLSNNSLAFNNGANSGAITDLYSINGQQYFPYAVQDLNSILANGNNANSQSITGLINVDLQTINGSSYPPATPALASVLAVGNGASNQNITGVNDLQVYSINGTYYPPYPIAPYGLTQTLTYSNDGNGLSLTNVAGIGSVNGTFTISSQNGGAIDINSSYDTNMSNTGTFTINNGNGVNINSANAIQIVSSSGSISTQSNQHTSIYSQQNLTLQVVSGYIYMYGLPTSAGGPANSLYNAGGIIMIN